MGFQKFTRGEQLDIFSDAANQIVNKALRKEGASTYANLSEEAKQQVKADVDALNIPSGSVVKVERNAQ